MRRVRDDAPLGVGASSRTRRTLRATIAVAILVVAGCRRDDPPDAGPIAEPLRVENAPGVVHVWATIRIVPEKVEEKDARIRWRWTLTSDANLAPVEADAWTVHLRQDRSSNRGAKAWVLDLAVATAEAPNGLMDVEFQRSLRPADTAAEKATGWPTRIRALQAPADRVVTVLADREMTKGPSTSLPLIRLNLKASDGASLSREVILKIDR